MLLQQEVEMFQVGQKVVCVDDKPRILPIHEIKKGEIYTISWFNPVFPDAVFIKEGLPYSFWADRFRPIVERKTDISIFKKLLNPANHKHLEGV
jgi:hypothetical protein